jgi:hypothetical protein
MGNDLLRTASRKRLGQAGLMPDLLVLFPLVAVLLGFAWGDLLAPM